eukprot:3714341-Pleurochrysis_carterae.AAC.1
MSSSPSFAAATVGSRSDMPASMPPVSLTLLQPRRLTGKGARFLRVTLELDIDAVPRVVGEAAQVPHARG